MIIWAKILKDDCAPYENWVQIILSDIRIKPVVSLSFLIFKIYFFSSYLSTEMATIVKTDPQTEIIEMKLHTLQ